MCLDRKYNPGANFPLQPFRKSVRQLSCSLYLLFTATVSVAAQVSMASPPVVLISVDTLRADRLSCYDYRASQTPHIDALARGGTIFSQVNAEVPLTLPSHASLLTSTHPFSNGVEDNGMQLGPNAVTLAAILKSQGYRTAAFVGGFVLDRRFGLAQGFDTYDSPFDVNRKQVADPGNVRRPGEEVVQAATRWIGRNRSAPFFVLLHLYDLHTPYDIPRRLRRPGRSDYDSALAHVDELIGTFLAFLSQRGLLRNALLVFISDHGEGLGEHAEGAHGYFIYQATLWVPLMIHWPSRSKPFPVRISEPATLLDVAPTILEYLGVPRPAEFQGQSLLGLVKGKSPPPGDGLYAESTYGQRHFGVAALRSVRRGRYKYIDAPRPEFYDLMRDPGETTNLYASRQHLASVYRDWLFSIRSRVGAVTPPSQVQSPEVQSRLKALGYVSGPASRTVGRQDAESGNSAPDPKDRIVVFERYVYALRLATSGHLNESRKILGELLTQDAGLIDVRLSLGLTLQQLNQHADAVQEFQKVLNKIR